MAQKPLTTFDTAGLERLAEAAMARKNETTAESTVHTSVTAMVTSALWNTVAHVKCEAPSGGSSAGWNIMATKSLSAWEVALPRSTVPYCMWMNVITVSTASTTSVICTDQLRSPAEVRRIFPPERSMTSAVDFLSCV